MDTPTDQNLYDGGENMKHMRNTPSDHSTTATDKEDVEKERHMIKKNHFLFHCFKVETKIRAQKKFIDFCLGE